MTTSLRGGLCVRVCACVCGGCLCAGVCMCVKLCERVCACILDAHPYARGYGNGNAYKQQHRMADTYGAEGQR